VHAATYWPQPVGTTRIVPCSTDFIAILLLLVSHDTKHMHPAAADLLGKGTPKVEQCVAYVLPLCMSQDRSSSSACGNLLAETSRSKKDVPCSLAG
jgi:hypothetical protein